MKTKKFLMTSLLVMGMIIAKAATGYPPELVLVSQPVLTYNANSVTIYYDVQNIGDYTYRGDLYIYLDPDNGYCYANEYMRIGAGSIRRIAVSIPAYRPNPSVTYTVMPYYELDGELYSFTTFEYFEPVRFCWNGYRNEPWVVIHVGPRPRYYRRPGAYRYYYDGYRPMMPPPGGPDGHRDMPPADPHYHTYGYHHNTGGYPANYHPTTPTPGYNPSENVKPNEGNNSSGDNGGGATVRPHSNNTPGSMSSNGTTNNNGGNNGGGNVGPTPSNGNNSGATTRPSSNSSNNSSSSSNVSRPSSNSSNTSGTTNSGRTGNSSNVSRPSSNNSNTSGTSSSGRSGNTSTTRSSNSSSNNRSGNSSSSSSSNRSSSSSNSRSNSSSSSSSSTRSSSSSTGGRR